MAMTNVQSETYGDASSGMCLYRHAGPGTPGRDVVRQQEKARVAWGKVHGRRKPVDEPTRPNLTYHDPGAPRDVDQAIADLARFEAKLDTHTRANHAAVIANRRALIPGYVCELTDGHFGVGRIGPTDTDRKTIVSSPIAWLGMLPETWARDYAPVRVCRRESHAVTWTFDDGRVTFYATTPDTAEARGWHPCPAIRLDTTDPISIILSDLYLWPMRGVSWEIGHTLITPDKDAIVLRAEDVAIVVVGMYDGGRR